MIEVWKNLSLNDLDGEIWKEIVGYDGYYFVSNIGRVKSFKKCRGTDVRILESFDISGYFTVGLCNHGKDKHEQIHRLMYEAFIGKIPEGYVVHHIDNNKINNNFDNFQLMTREEHSKIHQTGMKRSEESKELMSETRKEKFKNGELNLDGENNPFSILTEHQVKIIYQISNSPITKQLKITQKEIGKLFGVSRATISKIKHRRNWKHLK